MGRNDAPLSLAEIIEAAQKTPTGALKAPMDLSSPFGVPLPADHRVVNDVAAPGKAPGSVEYDYKSHIEFFSIPHDKDGYEETMNKVLAGNALLRYEEKTFTKDGDFLIALCYLTYTPNPKKLNRQRREEEEEREELIRRA